MKHRAAASALALALLPVAAPRAADLPATAISYRIEVTLDPAERRLAGRETIRWTNPSAATVVERIPLHLYLNGFAHEESTWMRTTLSRFEDAGDLIRRHDDPWGWIEPRAIRQGGAAVEWAPIAPDDGNPLDRSLIEIRLARPVGPGESLDLEVEFDARLPVPFARTGGFDDFFLVGQWFPKVAAFETAGVRGAAADRWNAHQFHGRTEFYADFADFDVRIGVPPGWSVAATGKGTDEGVAEGRAWRRFRQRAVHDFGFAAGAAVADVVSVHDPAGPGGPVEIHVFLPRRSETQAPRWRRAAEASLDVLGSRVGPYPYETLTVVMPPHHLTETWGMEYPTFITGLSGDPLWDTPPIAGVAANEAVVAHEFVHQYFYGLIATNEFEEAFLDEGFTQFWGAEVMRDAYGESLGSLLGRPLSVLGQERASAPRPDPMIPPIATRPSFLARGYNFGTQFYSRPASTLRTLEGLFGRETVDRIFAAYFDRWKFRHPCFEDFLATARDAAGEDAAAFLAEAFRQPRIPDYSVDVFETKRWESPRGRVVTGDGIVESDAPREGAQALAGLDPAGREEGGSLTLEVLDPGSMSGDRWGVIERRTVKPESGEPDPGWSSEADVFHVSQVRLAGPGWDHLPVEVVFRFADGAVVRDAWDGRAPYRTYRFLRPAPLSEVRVDPEGKIALDANPVNNGRRRDPDRDLADGWSRWLAGLFQFLAEATAQWL